MALVPSPPAFSEAPKMNSINFKDYHHPDVGGLLLEELQMIEKLEAFKEFVYYL